jgi:hypothetical protein
MNKRISCRIPGQKTHRPVLRDISNQKPTEGQLLALEYNKNRLATLKEQMERKDAAHSHLSRLLYDLLSVCTYLPLHQSRSFQLRDQRIILCL